MAERAVEGETAPPRPRLWPEVLRVSLPAVGENVAWSGGQTLLLMIAGLLGPGAIAGFGATESVRWFLATGVRAMSTGLVAVVARRVGARRYRSARAFALQALAFSVGLMAILGTAASINSRRILGAMGLSPAVVDFATPLAQLAFLATIPQAVYFTLASVLKASGDTRTPLVAMASRSVFMVIAAYLLIDGKLGLPALGIRAMGVGMVGAWGVAIVPLVWRLRMSPIPFRLSWQRGLRPRWVLSRRLASVGLPASVEELSLSVGQLVFTRILTSLGTAVYTAHLIGFNLAGYGFNVAFGFAIAASALVGQRLGAREPGLARAYAACAMGIGVAAIAVVGILLLVVGRPLAALYTDDLRVVSIFEHAAPIVAISLPGLGIFSILAGALRGAGDTKGPMYATLIGLWTVRLALAFLLGVVWRWGLVGVWLAWAVDQWARSIWILRRFQQGRWQQLRV